jgi:hypothetical protein
VEEFCSLHGLGDMTMDTFNQESGKTPFKFGAPKERHFGLELPCPMADGLTLQVQNAWFFPRLPFNLQSSYFRYTWLCQHLPKLIEPRTVEVIVPLSTCAFMLKNQYWGQAELDRMAHNFCCQIRNRRCDLLRETEERLEFNKANLEIYSRQNGAHLDHEEHERRSAHYQKILADVQMDRKISQNRCSVIGFGRSENRVQLVDTHTRQVIYEHFVGPSPLDALERETKERLVSIMNEHQVSVRSDFVTGGLSRDIIVFTQDVDERDMALRQISEFFSRHQTVIAQHKLVFDAFTSVLSFLKHPESYFQVGHQLLTNMMWKLDEMKAEINAKLDVVIDAVSSKGMSTSTKGKSAVRRRKPRNGSVGVKYSNNRVVSYFLQHYSLSENKWKRKYFPVAKVPQDKKNIKQFLLKESQLLKMNLSVVAGKLDELFGRLK